MIPTALRLTLMVGPPGRTPYNTHHNVCLMKLEWKKSGSESEQLTELDAMLAEYGIILSSEGTNGDPSSNETKMKIPSASNPQAVSVYKPNNIISKEDFVQLQPCEKVKKYSLKSVTLCLVSEKECFSELNKQGGDPESARHFNPQGCNQLSPTDYNQC